MAKKGKQKQGQNQPRDALPPQPPPQIQFSDPQGRQIAFASPGPASPVQFSHPVSPRSRQDSVASNSQGGDWGEQGWDDPDDQGDEDWPADERTTDHAWGDGAHTQVPAGDRVDHDGWPRPAQNQPDATALRNALAGVVPGAAQPMTRKNILKNSPNATHATSPAPFPPANKHVAFGVPSSHPSSMMGAPPSAPTIPGAFPPSLAASLANARPIPMDHNAPRGRTQSQGAFAKGWGAPGSTRGEGSSFAPAGFSSRTYSHPGGHPGHPAASSFEPAPNIQPAPMLEGAWTLWGREAQKYQGLGMGGPTVTTAIKAQIPTAASAPPTATSNLHANTAAHLLGTHAQLQSILGRTAQLNNAFMQGQNGLNNRREQISPPVPGFPHNTQAQHQPPSWNAWDGGNINAQGNRAHHVPSQPSRPPQMQQSDSWGTSEWTDLGGGRANASWGNEPDNGGWGGDDGEDGWPVETDPWGQGTHSAHESRKHKRSKSENETHQRGRAENNSWGDSNDNKRGRTRGRRASTSHGHGGWGDIPEEEEDNNEEYAEEEDYDDLEDMYAQPDEWNRHDKQKSRTHSGISYQYQSPEDRTHQPGITGFPGSHPSPLGGRHDGQGARSPLLPDPAASKTMNFATGRMAKVFDFVPPAKGSGEGVPIESHGAGLQPAQRALYSKRRLAKERILWAFNPDKDPRVSSLLRWIQAMSNVLAYTGLQKLIETGQRGALFANADFRTSHSGSTQPAFDWLTLEQLRPTSDRILQESVVSYKPDQQVLVFVFLLSKSENSMAIWRRKLVIPEGMRKANRDVITQVMETLPEDRVVYVDEILPRNEPPPPPPKKRGFWRRLFGMK